VYFLHKTLDCIDYFCYDVWKLIKKAE